MTVSEIKISEDDFDSVNWKDLIKKNPERTTIDSLYELFSEETKKFDEDSSEWKVYFLLREITSFVLDHYDDSQEIYIPRSTFDTKRTVLPQDLTKEQYEVLALILDQIDHYDLKARLADILWLERIGEKPFQFGVIAIEAYLKIVDILISSEKDQLSAFDRLRRAIHLSKEINSNQIEVRTVLEEYIEKGSFNNIVLLLLLEILAEFFVNVQIDVEKFSREFAEELIEQNEYTLAVRCWHNNAIWNKRAGNNEMSRNAQIKIAEIYSEQATVAMTSEKHSMASYYWEQAIYQYRRIEDTQAERDYCMQELLKCQERIPEGLVTKSMEVSVQKMAEIIKKRYYGQSLQESIIILGLSETSPEKTVIEKEVSQNIKDNPMSYLFQSIYIDNRGRNISKSKDFNLNGDNRDLLHDQMHSHSKYYQSFYVHGYILPSIRQITFDHRIRKEDLDFLVRNNPYIVPGTEYLILKGIHAGFANDFVVSSHILTLQIEGIVRYLLNQNGINTSSLTDKGIQEDFDINNLLSMPETVDIFGEDLVFDLQSLLVNRFGSNFRNKLAHSLLTMQDFFSYPSVYLWWIVLHIICRPFYKQFLTIIENFENHQKEK